MVHLSNSSRVTRIIFFFLFGFPEGTENLEEEKSAVEEHHSKDEKEENKVEEDEYKIEEIDDMLDFMQNDQLFVHNGNFEDQDLFKLDEDFIIPKDNPLLEDDPLLFEDPLPLDDPLFGNNIDEEIPMVRIGNQMMAGPQQTNNPEPEARRRDRGRDANKNSGKRGARSVSVLAIKDPKAELDVLASILDGVEKVEKEVKDNFEKEEEADFQVKIKTSKHLVGELSKSIVMGIISDEKYMSTVSLKLIEIFLKTRDKEVLEALVYRCIRYLSEDEPDDINICEYFEKEVLQNQEEVKIDPNKNCNSQNLSNLTTSDTENSETKEGERSLIKRFNSKLSLIQMTLNPKSDFFMFDDEFLESGLLFAVLLKKLSSMLNNPRIDNLILTEIWLQIGSLPVDRERPETFYLYAFCFQDISKLANSMSKIGLFASVESIHEQISKCNLGEDLDPLLFYRKKELKVIPEDSIPPLSSRTEEEYLNIISGKTNRIDAIMVFQEFLKEYTSLSHFQRWFIKMINKYDQVHQEDIEFDTLIQHL